MKRDYKAEVELVYQAWEGDAPAAQVGNATALFLRRVIVNGQDVPFTTAKLDGEIAKVTIEMMATKVTTRIAVDPWEENHD